ncbi:MAG: hypothetical protein ABFS14_00730 [Gemmatimonadota bacterium]
MDSDQTAPGPEFQDITFHGEHESACDLDTHCPSCGQFYVPRPLVVAAGTIMFMGAYSLRTGPADQAAAISAGLFLILAFYFISVLRSRPYELGILATSAVGVFVLFFAARPMAMFAGSPPEFLVLLGIVALFSTVVLAGKHGVSDSSALAGGEPGSQAVLLIAAANLLLLFVIWTLETVSAATSLRSDTWLAFAAEHLPLIHWISLALACFLVLVFAFISASRQQAWWEEVEPKTRDLPARGVIARALAANSNLLANIRAAAQNGWRAVNEFFKETGRAILRIVAMTVVRLVAVLISLSRQGLILLGLTILAVFSVTLAIEIAILWQQQSMFKPVLIFWPQAIVLTVLVIALSTLIGGLSFKRWSARPRAGASVRTLFSATVGTTQQLNTALRSLVFSAVWFLFYTAVSLWFAWLAVNILSGAQERAVPRTLGLGFIGASVLFVFLLWQIRPRRQSRLSAKAVERPARRFFLAGD